MPDVHKRALVLKNPSLNNVHKNYRPDSNLSFISKLIENVVNIQFTQHIETNVFNEKV